MISIKLPYQTTQENLEVIKDLQRQYSSLARWSFNRYKDCWSQKKIRQESNHLSNVELGSWLQQCAIKDAEAIYKQNPDRKLIFGTKKQFYRRIKGLITKEEFQKSRLRPLIIQGEKIQKGNRLFNLDIINNNQILESVKDQWKEYLTEDIKSWKELFLNIKNLKLKYRVSLDVKYLEFFSHKSRVGFYHFYS